MRKKKTNRIIAFIIAVIAIFCVFAGLAMAKDVSKLIFSGMTMEANEDSVQGFLDFKVKNIENNGVEYTLEYDTNYVELSDVATNAECPVSSGFIPNPSFLKMNTQDFASNVFITQAQVFDSTDGKYAKVHLRMTLSPLSSGKNIGEKVVGSNEGVGDVVKVIQAGDKELTLGSLSFRIKDPAAFAKLSDQDLMNVFRIETTDDGNSIFKINYIDTTSYPALVFYDDSSHLDYEFNVKNTIKSVEINEASRTVTAAEIFQKGDVSDLIAYLNSYMRDVTVTYADGAQVADTITWGGRDNNFSCDVSWNPKGGTYIVTQQYNEEFTVRAVVEVTPVSVTGYVVDDDLIHYDTVDDIPVDLPALKASGVLPTKARPVFSVLLPSSFTYKIDINGDSWEQILPTDNDLFTDRAEGQYTFAAGVNVNTFPAWVTVDENVAVTVDVAVGEVTPEPEVTAVVYDDGLLKITVSRVGELNPLPSGMDFLVRLPNGEVLNHDNFTNADDGGGKFEVLLNNPADGEATINLKAEDLTKAQQAALQQSINLGKRYGSFAVSAKSADLPRSNWVSVAAEPRSNIYVDLDGDGVYNFDYSVTGAQIFNIANDMEAPPTTITLAGSDRVNTRYSGYDGTEPGSLKTVAVREWTRTAGTMTVGESVTFEGILADTSYLNFGEVTNPDDVKISLTLQVVDAADSERINDIDDFRFSKKQVGYTAGEVQTAGFNISNVGNVAIYGLTVTLDSDDFIVVGSPAYYLAQGNSTSFQIKPKEGLLAGDYSGKVTISSNRTQVLDTFNVYFTVTDNPVYELRVSAYPQDAGTVTAADGYYYEAGDTVTLQAVPAEDCTLDHWWVSAGPPVSFAPDDKTDTVTFRMPDVGNLGYITIQADFDQPTVAKLKLQDLQLFNPDDSENDLLDSNYANVNFDPNTREYWAVAPSGAEENKVSFVIDSDVNMDVNATLQVDGGAAKTLSLNNRGSGVYDISSVPLTVAPADNLLTISLTADGETREYKVHIYRKLATDKMVQFGYGNSPYGLIMNDSNVASADKDAWKSEFDKGNCFTGNFTPAGGKTGLVYHPDAWGGSTNYDRIDEALFVYSGESFTDPGIIRLMNSLGGTIDISTNSNLVERTVTVNRMILENQDNLMNDFRTVTSETLDLGTSDTIDAFSGMRIRPGIYFINYIFKDFDGSSVSVQRPLIVLAERGDVNIDGNINEADASLIANRFNVRLPYENLPGFENGTRLYQYRVCDANVDRNVNVGDSNTILQYMDTMVQFYK